jgi:peptidoglycan/LPS O-acetylase OafA/YrhL
MTTAPSRPLTSDAPPRRGSSGFGYLPGLDGLRAISVMAVIFYHADIVQIGGGFLGVEVFFVISGYLITSLLLAESWRSGRTSLRNFWTRRARRLFPALYALLIAVVFVSAVFIPDAFEQLQGDVVAAFFYVSNWWNIIHEQSYFVAAGRPPLLLHLWSLAIEEQFYLFLPVIFAVFFGALRKRRLAIAAVIGALASTIWMATLYTPGEDPSRVYYGTDTRLSGLLLGVALATMWPPNGFNERQVGKRAGPVLDGMGLVGLAILAWAFVRLNEFDSFIYEGGFLLIDVATLAVIGVVVHPASKLKRWLGVGWLAWIGRRSYGLYLWHWPVFVLTRPDLDVPIHGWALFAFRMSITLVLTEISFRLIETPIRNGAIRRHIDELRSPTSTARRRHARQAIGFGSVAGLLAIVVLVVGPIAEPPDTTIDTTLTEIADDPALIEPDPPADETIAQAAAEQATDSAPAPTEAPVAGAPAPGRTETPALWAGTPVPGGVTAVGDSVIIGAAQHLRNHVPDVSINAKVARQFDEAIWVVAGLRDQQQLADNILIHMGTNGWLSAGQFDHLMDSADGRNVVWVNVRAPRSWEGITNQRIQEGVDRWPNATLVDWNGHSANHPDWFAADGVHLTDPGGNAYGGLIRRHLP